MKGKDKGRDKPEPLANLADLSERFGVHRDTLRHEIKIGRLSGHKIGGQWRFTQADIDAYLDATSVRARPLPVEDQPPRLRAAP